MPNVSSAVAPCPGPHMAEHLRSKLLPRSTCRNSTASLSDGERGLETQPHAWDDQTCWLRCSCQGTGASCRNVPPASHSGTLRPRRGLGRYVRGMTDNSPSCCHPALGGTKMGGSGLIFSSCHRAAGKEAAVPSCARTAISNSPVMGSG